jgi:hypothetical protein
MGIRDNRGQESPTPFRHDTPGNAGLPFSVAHIIVARGRDDEKRPSAQGQLSQLMESQVEYGGIAKSRIPAARKNRLCEDRLVDPEDVLYAGHHERPVKPQQLLVS